MFFVTGDQELRFGSCRTFKDAVVIIFGLNNLDLLRSLDKMGNSGYGANAILRFFFAEAELLLENAVHEALFSCLMDESIDVFLGPDAEGLGLECGLSLEFSPAAFLKVEAQSLTD